MITGTFEDTTDYLLTEDANEILRILGSNIVDAVMIDHDTLSVSDFASSNLTTYTFDADSGSWQKADTKRVSPRDSSSASFGGKTLLLTNSSSFGGKPSLRSVSNGTVSDVACDVLAANDSAVLSSDSAGFAMTVIHQDNGVMSAVVYRSTDGLSWTAEGANVASPIMYASNVARLDGNDYCLTAADGVATLRSHASSDVPKITHIVRYVTGTDSSIPNATVDDGDALPLPADPTRDGYRFLGWYDAETGGNRLDGTNTVTSDITVYARWERIIPTYTLSYDLNGGDGTIATASVKEGEKVTIPTDPTRNGYKFLGWFTERNGGSKVSSDTVVTGNITVHARWERIIPTYTVSYDVNGGNGSYSPTTVKEGEKITLPADPTREGYKFLGWFTTPTGGDKVTSDTAVAGNMTLYAHWNEIKKSFALTYDTDGGKHIDPVTLADGDRLPLPTSTRRGYTFLGWYDAKDGGNRLTPGTSTISGDMTAYARWQKETTGENTNAGSSTNGNGNTNTGTNGNTGSDGSNENTGGNGNGNENAGTNSNTGGNVNNGAAENDSNGSASPDDNLLGNATDKKDGKNDGTENGKPKLPTMLQQTGVTVSIFIVIGAAIGAVAAIVAAIRKRK